MKMDFYVNYPGTCEDAFRFYEQHLGGLNLSIRRHHEMNPAVAEDWKDKIVHATIEIGGAVLMGADIPGAQPMRSAYVTLTVASDDEAERIYAQLTDGGEIFMKMETTPFASRFAMFRDRFGTSWMLMARAGVG